MTVNPSLFKKYDIRGVAMGEKAILSPDAARLIGQSIGTYMQRMEASTRVVTGRDNRLTSADLHDALNEGLRKSGMDVVDIGLVSTPLVYWHAVNMGNIGGVMVTGSHLTSEYNGFKMSIGSRNLYGAQITQMARLIEDDKLAYGSGGYEVNSSAYSQYIHDLADRLQMARPLKVVIDPGNGTGGIFAPRLFELWGHQVSGIYLDPDGRYPNHLPNPQEAENVADLAAKVLETGADLGIGFDGDADRMGLVDEKGQLIAADRVLALLAQDMLQRHPSAAVVGEVLCSQVLFDTVKRAGGVPYMAASGHSLVKEMMREKHAMLGGEMSGHIFLGEDYFGFDDGFFAAGRVMQLLAASDQTMSELDDSLPRFYSTPEYRPHCPDDLKSLVIDAVAGAMADKGQISRIDGVRVQFEEGWGILRASNTEPVLSLRFEAQSEAAALRYRSLFVNLLQQFPEVERFA